MKTATLTTTKATARAVAIAEPVRETIAPPKDGDKIRVTYSAYQPDMVGSYFFVHYCARYAAPFDKRNIGRYVVYLHCSKVTQERWSIVDLIAYANSDALFADGFRFEIDPVGYDKALTELLSTYMTVYNPKFIKAFSSNSPVKRVNSAIATVGSDPEVFVVDANGMLIPAWTFLPKKGSESARNVRSQYANQVFWDGFQAEMTPQAKSCLGWHGDALHDCLLEIATRARKVNGVLTPQTTFTVDHQTLETASEEHVALGCMPSENVYGTEARLRADSGRELDVRSAGCHIHLGFTQPALLEQAVFVPRAVRMMDRLAGVSLTALLEGLEDPRRRMYYGLAGEYRMPRYGVEYRTPSSACLAASWIFQYTVDIVRACANLAWYGWDEHWKADDDEVIHTINNLDVEHARTILKRNMPMFANVLTIVYPSFFGDTNPLNKFIQLFMDGAVNALPDTPDMMKNWQLREEDEGAWITHCNGSTCSVHKLVHVNSGALHKAYPQVKEMFV